jgi:hypothetical protein
MMGLKFERQFQLFLYTSSHSQVLFRSLQTQADNKKVEILFTNVKYICTPCVFEGFNLQEVSQDAVPDVIGDQVFVPQASHRFFRLFGEGWSGLVVAGNIDWIEDESDFHEDSKLLVAPYVGGVYAKYSLRRIFGRLWFLLQSRYRG